MLRQLLMNSQNNRDEDFNPVSVNIKLCFLNIYNIVSYCGITGWLIASIVYLIKFRWMRTACEPVFNLWLYICLSLFAVFGSALATGCIRDTVTAKLWLLIGRHAIVTIVAYAFASYGSGVLANGKQAMVDTNKECAGAIIPYRFGDLVLATDVLSWIVALYFTLLALSYALFGMKWLTRKPKYVHLDEANEFAMHDPSLIVGKRSDGDSDGEMNADDAAEAVKRMDNAPMEEFDMLEDPHSQHINKHSRIVKSGDNVILDNIYRDDPTDTRPLYVMNPPAADTPSNVPTDKSRIGGAIKSVGSAIRRATQSKMKSGEDEKPVTGKSLLDEEDDSVELGMNVSGHAAGGPTTSRRRAKPPHPSDTDSGI